MSMSAATVTCRSCGAEIEENALLCPKCGQPNVSTDFATTDYSALAEPSAAAQPPTPPASGPEPSTEERGPAVTVAMAPRVPAEPAVEAAAQPAGELAPAEAGTPTIPLPAWLLPGVIASSPTEPGEDPFFLPPSDRPLPGVPAMLMGVGLGQPLDVPSAPETDFEAVEHQQAPSAGSQYTTRSIAWNRSGGRSFPSDPFASPGYDNVAEEVRKETKGPGWFRWRPRAQAAFLLELLGYIGFLGIGRIYAGQLRLGLGMLVFWWFILARGGLFALRLGEDGLFFVLLFLLVPLVDAWQLRREIEKRFGGA